MQPKPPQPTGCGGFWIPNPDVCRHRAPHAHLEPGGRAALADLDAGDFHPPAIEGVFHAGFDRGALGALMVEAGFEAPRFVTACEVTRDGKAYPNFLVTASKPA